MHLKTLTVRGFKSFASPTTFRLEPGITCVVGPNGSGKSNVVDAIAWVLGEQGAKALRGGQMSDVIFAGTPGRPALGRAEVTLTIDNADGALAVDYSEVSISRLMFRSGESEYAINGTACRLLDVQELMSDSGIGRELHVIVGQGQLDAVLQARPEDRRAFIEEAAGVLKHRKRKEKALRKLDAMQANLARVTDLTSELRRQLGPLGRQADIARRAGGIQSALRDARLRLLADDLMTLRGVVAAELADEQADRQRREQAEQALATARARETDLDEQLAAAAPAAARAQETYYRSAGLRERTRSLQQLAGERARGLATTLDESPAREPADLSSEAADARGQAAQVSADLGRELARLQALTEVRQQAQTVLGEREQALAAATRAAADRREGVARLAGQVQTAESRLATAAGEDERLAVSIAAADTRATECSAELAALRGLFGQLDQGEVALDARHERAVAALVELDEAVAALLALERDADRDAAAASARLEALSLSLDPRDGAAALLSASMPGLIGALVPLVTVQPGAEAALGAALGIRADAIAVATPQAAAQALRLLQDRQAGRAVLLVADVDGPEQQGPPPVGRWATDLVSAPAAVAGAVRRSLARIVVVADLDEAQTAISADPGVSAVTLAGDLLAADWAAGGSPSAPSLLEVRAAVDDARTRLVAASQRAGAARADSAELAVRRRSAETDLETAVQALHDSDARMAAVGERLSLLAAAEREAAADVARLRRRRAEVQSAVTGYDAELAALRTRLGSATRGPDEDSAGALAPAGRDEALSAVEAARAEEVQALLAVRTHEERAAALNARATQLEAAAAATAEQQRRAAARVRRAAAAGAVAVVGAAAAALDDAVEVAVTAASVERDEAATRRGEVDVEAQQVRAQIRVLAADAAALLDVAHRDEVARTEQRLRVEALEAKAAEDYGVDADALLAGYGPHVPVPILADPAAEPDSEAAVEPYDRATQTKRAAAAERQLAQLGRVNPLALEEFAALEERHAFLAAQLQDLTTTRRELLGIIAEVDSHIHDIFRAAFDDTAREFEQVFATLFPGGSGRLELTDPENLMATGIEVVARPAGKKVSRLSLLSGGERALAAIALLVAIFRARPSPFYVLDEVEAALDDRNLQRLLAALVALREHSQLVIITHQKRTMEIADVLYGVSMRGDGVSTVISQRLREAVTA